MKILFFSQDDAVVDLIEGVGHENMIVTDDNQFVLDQSESARCLIFLDFDENKKAAEKLNKELMDGDDVRIVMTEKIKLKDLKKHQKGATAADGYVRKPISLKIINEILNDFELSDYIQASEAFEEGDQLGEVPLSSIEGADSEFDEDSEVDFNAGVMKVDDRVKKQLDAHSVSSESGPNFATPLNVDIQNKFDMVFDRPFLPEKTKSKVNIPAPMEQQAGAPASIAPAPDGDFDLDMGAEEDNEEEIDINLGEEESLDVGLSMDEEESEEPEDLDINLSEETESEELDLGAEEPLEAAPSQEEAMEDDNDLDFDVEEEEEELEEGALEFGGATESLEDEPEDEKVEGLDFATAEESDEALSIGEDSETNEEETEEAGGFDLGSDDSDDALDLGSDDSDDALDLGSDDSAGALDLGGEDDSLDLGSDDALDLGGEDDSLDLGAEDEALDLGDEDEALDLGSDDSSSSLDLGSDDDALDLGSEENLDLGEEDNEEEALDLGESEEDALDLGEPDSLDADDSFDEVSTTIEGIIAVDEDSDDDGELNILSDADGLDSEDESLSFSDDEAGVDEEDFGEGTLTGTDSEVLDFSDGDEEVGEGTNPTIVMGSEDNSLKEFKAGLPNDQSLDDEDDELDLSGIEEDTGEDLLADDEDEEETLDLTSEENEIDEDLTVTEVLETSEPEAPAPAPVKEEAVQKVAPPAPTAVDEQIIITPEEQRVAEAFNQTEQARLQGTIRQLREEREELLKEIHELKTESKLGDQDKLGLRAELDEARIEIQILKKRNHDEIDELKYRVRLSEEKKHIYEERAKSIQKEFDRLNQKVRIDINQVKQREKELESQLELISMDSQSQVKSRDMKILDLKRKIDSLEFNMENASIREVKSREDKEKVEERLEKIMRTLRGSLKSLESDNDLDDGILDKIDKL
jgi:hypothetical protein